MLLGCGFSLLRCVGSKHSPFDLCWALVIAQSTWWRKQLVETQATSLTSISVNVAVFQDLKPRKVIWVAVNHLQFGHNFAAYSNIEWYKTSQTVTSLAEFGKFLYGITKIDSRSRRKGFPTLTLIVIAGDTTYLMLSWADWFRYYHIIFIWFCDSGQKYGLN